MTRDAKEIRVIGESKGNVYDFVSMLGCTNPLNHSP